MKLLTDISSTFTGIFNILIIGVIVIIGVRFGADFLGSKTYEPEIPAYPDSVWNTHIEYRDTVIFIPRIEAVIDTVIIDNTMIQVAFADSIMIKDNNIISVRYFFPPLNYFQVDAHLSEKVVYQTLTITQWRDPPKERWYKRFINRFGISVQSGAGVGLIHKNFDIYLGIGIHFKI